MRQIVFYKTKSGKEPIREFLDALQPKHAQRVTWVLGLVEELSIIPRQFFKKLQSTDDIWEVRVQAGGNAYRLLGFWDGPEYVVLCHAFAKKAQKLRRQDIQTAEERKDDYFRRKGQNE